MNNRLEVKDLVNIGLFSVLSILFYWGGGMIGMMPTLMPLVPFAGALLAGPVNMLYSTKIRKPGMVFIQSILISLAFVATGHGPWILLTGSVVAIVAEIVLKKGGYRSVKAARRCYTVMGVSVFGNFIPIMFAREAYMQQMLAQGWSQDFIDAFTTAMPDWIFIPSILLGAVGGYLGCTIGIRMLNKHFVKAKMV